jgi:hypothetical protein
MKVQVMINDDLVKKIDLYANMLGVSRSFLCALFIGQGIVGYSKSFDAIDSLVGKMADKIDSDELKGQLDIKAFLPKIEEDKPIKARKKKKGEEAEGR